MAKTVDFLGKFVDSNVLAKVLRVFVFDRATLTMNDIVRRSGLTHRKAQEAIDELEALKIIKRTRIVISIGAKKIAARKQKQPAWTYNVAFPHAQALARFVHEVSPVQYKQVIAGLRNAGKLTTVVLSGSFVGDENRPADLLVVLENLSEGRLDKAVRGLEPHIGREIRYAGFSVHEFQYRLTIQDRLLRDTFDYPHIVLLDKTGLL